MKYFNFLNIGLAMEYLPQPWCNANLMYVGCKLWNTANILCLWAQLTTTECVRIEQQITKCKEENKACAMMESPAEGQQQVVRLQV